MSGLYVGILHSQPSSYLFKLIPGTGPYTINEKDIINQESYILTRRKDYWQA